MTTPTVNRQATLSIPGLEELPAKIAAVEESYTDLTLLRAPRSTYAQLEHSQAYMDFMTDEGVWRTIGTIGVLSDNGNHLVRFEPRGRVQLLQRRAFVRTDLIAMCLVHPRREGVPPQKGLTLNVSGGGLLIRGLQRVEAGDELGFDLRLDLLPARIQGEMKIVRVTPEGFAGTMFTQIDDADRDKLVHFAYTRERTAAQHRRRG